jgi:hypothetical protein
MEIQEFITALSDEKRRIQEALLSAGYFAYSVKFFPTDREGNTLPRLEIEARPGDDEDRVRLG